MHGICDFFGAIGDAAITTTQAALSKIIPITMLSISLLIAWPTISGLLGLYDGMANMQQECREQPMPHGFGQCYEE